MLLTSLTLLALSAPALAQQELAPYGNPGTVTPAAASNGSNRAVGCGNVEDFETYVVPLGGAHNLNTLTLDDTTVANGQGPGLVLDGVTYYCNGNTLQWNGDQYFGLSTKTFLANTTDGLLGMKYDQPQTDVTFSLHAFAGFADVAIVTVFNSAGTAVFSSGLLNVPGPTAVPFTYSGTDLRSVTVQGRNYSWSPLVDNHEFCAGGKNLTVSNAVAGGTATVTVNGATGPVGLAYSLAFGTANYNVAGCTGTLNGFGPTFTVLGVLPTAGGTGNLNVNVPPGTTGVTAVVACLDLGGNCATDTARVTVQ